MSEQNAPARPWRADVIADFARSELFQRTFQDIAENFNCSMRVLSKTHTRRYFVFIDDHKV